MAKAKSHELTVSGRTQDTDRLKQDEEVLMVVRGTVTKITEHTRAGVHIRTAGVKVKASAQVPAAMVGAVDQLMPVPDEEIPGQQSIDDA